MGAVVADLVLGWGGQGRDGRCGSGRAYLTLRR